MELSVENLSKFFPYYLTEERKAGLLAALKGIPDQRPYYVTLVDPEPLQGDGWAGLQILRFEDGSRDRVKGVVMTNSCDLAADNTRLLPPLLTFAPLVRLKDYVALLESNGIPQSRLTQHTQDVRGQAINSLFYLPAGLGLAEEHIVLLQDLHTIPLVAFNADSEKSRMFSLSDVGFYLFVFKLSVHFCRLHENVDRTPSVESAAQPF
ncbi:MAG: hypothetical protein ACYCZT_02890 [Thiobacillus sp.]